MTTQNSTDLFNSRYELKEFIGQGCNAVVKRCIRRSDGIPFAVKISEVEEEHLLYLRKIFNIALNLGLLKHRNILGYHEMYINMKRRTCKLVMDYIPHSDLGDCIHPKDKSVPYLSEGEMKDVMRQLLDVIRFLHSQNICHRDVKPDNILYDRVQGRIWLIDLGISKFLIDNNVRKEMMTDTGTTDYKAPEMFEGGKYT